MAIVKALSFQEDVFKYAKEEAEEMFGNNLSAFVTYLICNYRRNNPKRFKIDKELGEELKNQLIKVPDSQY
jgi:hypothetical protein